MKLVRILVDRDHTKKLFRGQPVTIRVPQGATVLELNLDAPKPNDKDLNSIAKIIDVFFNGRKA